MPSKETPHDVVVVGAGCFGLAAAKSYIQLHPSDKILVLESSHTCGGTWAADRLYPGLKTNNLVGSYEFPDFPMDEATYGVAPMNHIPGSVLHRYVTDYAKKFGVFGSILFDTRTESIEILANGNWAIKVQSAGAAKTLESKKVIIATGLTSSPNMLTFPGQETFGAPIFHAKDFHTRSDTIKESKNAVIIGGAKSAMDVAHAYAVQGVTVDLVIRPDGNGPGWLVPPLVTPLRRKAEELMHTRLSTWFSPCPWGAEDGYTGVRNFLNSFAIGRWLMRGFWHLMSDDVITAHAYAKNARLNLLKPWNSAFWQASGISVDNYNGELFNFVREGKVRVHIANVDRLGKQSVVLSTGETLRADVLVCATGWKKDPSIKFLNYDIAPQIQQVEMEKLVAKSEQEILTRFPILKEQPDLNFTPTSKNPLQMYRFMVPTASLAKRNIAFAGAASTVSTAICASLQGLWISAYFDGNLQRIAPTEGDAIKEAVLNAEWVRWRYPCGYINLPDFAFDVVPYFDLLLKDMGLNNWRKTSFLKEIFLPYKPWDYANVVQEFKHAHAN